MAFYGYKGDVGECHWTPYSSSTYDYDALLPPPASLAYSSYEIVEPRSIDYSPYSSGAYDYDALLPPPASLAYSSYEINEPRVIEHGPYNYFDSYTTQPEQNYSVYSFAEPRLIQYEPPPSYAVDSFYSQTNYKTSYSTLEFTEPVWEEFDPTPYDGGYDQTQTYGKPLPPSDEICYPRSAPQPNGDLLDGFSYASIPPAYGDRKNDQPKKPDNESKSTDTKEQESMDGDGDNATKGTDADVEDGDLEKPLEEERGDVDEKPLEQERGEVDGYPASDYGRNGGYVHEWNKQVPYIPHGSGLESLDLCESIFGYWPCLAKIEQQKRREKCQVCDEQNRYDPWKSTADYLFGSPFAYGEQRDGGNGNYYSGNGCYYQYQHQ